MTRYYTEREKKMMAEIQPILKRLDYEQAQKLERLFYDWKELIDTIKSMESDVEVFQRDHMKDESLAGYCKGLSEADSATMSKFLKDIKETADHYVGYLYDDREVLYAFELDCYERYWEGEIIVTCPDGSTFNLRGEEAREFNDEFHHIAKEINLNHDGQVRVTLEDGATMDYSYGSTDANWLFDQLDVEQGGGWIAAKD